MNTGQTSGCRNSGACGEGGRSNEMRVEVLLHALGMGSLLSLGLLVVRDSDGALATLGMPLLLCMAYGLLAGMLLWSVGCLVCRTLRGRAGHVGARGEEADTRASASGLAVPTSQLASRRSAARATLALAMGLVGLAGILVVGMTQQLPMTVGPASPLKAAMLACGVALGVGLSVFALMWTELAVRMRPRSVMLATGLALVVCGVSQAMLALVRDPWAGALLGMALAVLCAASLIAALRLEGERRMHSTCPTPKGPDTGEAQGEPARQLDSRRMLFALSDGAGRIVTARGGVPRLRDVCAMSWVSLASLAFCGFITGLTWDPVASEEVAWRGPIIGAVGVMAGACVCAATLLFVRHARDEASSLAMLTRVLEPVSLAIVLVVPIVKQWTDYTLVLSVATSILSIVGFAMITSIAFIEITTILRFGGLSCRLVVPAVVALLAGVARVRHGVDRISRQQRSHPVFRARGHSLHGGRDLVCHEIERHIGERVICGCGGRGFCGWA